MTNKNAAAAAAAAAASESDDESEYETDDGSSSDTSTGTATVTQQHQVSQQQQGQLPPQQKQHQVPQQQQQQQRQLPPQQQQHQVPQQQQQHQVPQQQQRQLPPQQQQQLPQQQEESDDHSDSDSDSGSGSGSGSDSDETAKSPCASAPVVPNPVPKSPLKVPSVIVSNNNKRLALEDSDTRNIDNLSGLKKMKLSSTGDGPVDKGKKVVSWDQEAADLREKKDGNHDAVMEDNREQTHQDYWSLYPLLCASLQSDASSLTPEIGDFKEYVRKMINGFGEDKARQLEDGWEAVSAMNHKLKAERAVLISKQAQLVMDAQTLSLRPRE